MGGDSTRLLPYPGPVQVRDGWTGPDGSLQSIAVVSWIPTSRGSMYSGLTGSIAEQKTISSCSGRKCSLCRAESMWEGSSRRVIQSFLHFIRSLLLKSPLISLLSLCCVSWTFNIHPPPPPCVLPSHSNSFTPHLLHLSLLLSSSL